MPPDQDDVDAMFGGSPAPAASPLGGAAAAADSRRESRVRANWRARVLLPDERIIELNVFDLAESGIGLISDVGIPAHTVLPVVLAVPSLKDSTQIKPMQGTVKTTHMTIRGQFVHCGGQWVQLDGDSRELLSQWIRKLRK
jgi:hypothetical protein